MRKILLIIGCLLFLAACSNGPAWGGNTNPRNGWVRIEGTKVDYRCEGPNMVYWGSNGDTSVAANDPRCTG